ncbi:hypothetical protein [Yoonia sp. BS5-3]|uniref:Sulfotransferase family protein n=1 Tax=Yoonia phaeophyticola TaxID=3137369 RepID=A0ABZ2VA64_9RHOB
MTPPDFTVAFHVGAHKTATTHLQRSLQTVADPLADAGVRLYSPKYFRLPGRSIPALFGLKDGPPDPARRSPADQLALMRKDADRVIFSEENYIGVLNSPRRFPVQVRYPHAADRVAALAEAIGRPIDVFLGIRQPTAFLSSAYCQMLMGGRAMPLDRFKRINPITSVDWLDLVTRLRGAKGVGQLTVWRHEDYADVFTQICAGLVGPDRAQIVAPLPRRIHEGLSAAAVTETLQRHAAGEGDKAGFAMRKMWPVGPAHPSFDGFDSDEHARAAAAYAAQTAAIAGMEDVTFLK